MPSTNREIRNKTNSEYYHRNKDRLLPIYNERSLLYYEQNTAKKLASQLKWRENHPEKNIWNRAKQRSKRLNIEFTIDVSDIIIPEFCPILGIKLTAPNKKVSDSSYSMDRIDNTKGYIKGNIQIISQRANRLKSDSSIEELEKIVSYLRNRKISR